MLHVLRHYIPLRKALLIVSETILLTLVLSLGMSAHIWVPTDATMKELTWAGLRPESARWQVFVSSLLVSVIAQITIAFNELYDFRISSSHYERAARFLGSAGTAIVIATATVALMDIWRLQAILDFPGLPLAQTVVLLSANMALGFALLYLWRYVFHLVLRRTNLNERILILGSGRFARRLIDEVVGRSDAGFDIVGVLPCEPRAAALRHPTAPHAPPGGTGNPWFEAASQHPAPALGKKGAGSATVEGALVTKSESGVRPLVLADSQDEEDAAMVSAPPADFDADSLLSLAERLRVDNIIVALEERRGSLPVEELLNCRLEGITVTEAEVLFERVTGKIPAELMRPAYLIFNPGFLQHPLAFAAKRLLDFSLALAGILVAWPLMLLAALLIRWDSRGPILFRQERLGRNGRTFTLCKFRSMREDAERLTGPVWASADDPRITRVGQFLRRTRIDELPQLFNVLGGSMSFVGPRPERPHFVAELAETIPYYFQRHLVKPGITGWAQINYPYGNTLEDALQKLQYDLFYIKYQSMLFDLSIVFNTIKTVLLRKGT